MISETQAFALKHSKVNQTQQSWQLHKNPRFCRFRRVFCIIDLRTIICKYMDMNVKFLIINTDVQ